MDANLFGSFSQSQSQKRRRSSSRKSDLPSSKPAPESSTKQRDAVAEPKLRLVDSGREDKLGSALKDSKKASEATSVLKKPKPIKTLSEFDIVDVMITLTLISEFFSLFQRILMTFLTFSRKAKTRTRLLRRGKNQKSS